MKKNISDIKEYWEKRAKDAQLNPNSTTEDVYLRELEIKSFIESIKKQHKKNPSILDVGCGDGFTTIGVAKKIRDGRFIGIDYSKNMIATANRRLQKENKDLKSRVAFDIRDARKIYSLYKENAFDIVLSSRCLINFPSKRMQYATLDQISKILKRNGVYISTENFEDGNQELNTVRKQIGLPEIPVRWHNLYFNLKEYKKKTGKIFRSVEIINFSSSYYYATRVIYSKFCQMKHNEPDYLHGIHKLSVNLPPTGNYSPIKLIIQKK